MSSRSASPKSPQRETRKQSHFVGDLGPHAAGHGKNVVVVVQLLGSQAQTDRADAEGVGWFSYATQGTHSVNPPTPAETAGRRRAELQLRPRPRTHARTPFTTGRSRRTRTQAISQQSLKGKDRSE